MTMRTAWSGRVVGSALAAWVVLLGGCNIVAPALYVIEGPPKAEAVASLEKSRATVFFIDDRRSVLPRRILRDEIGTAAERHLLARGVVADGNMIAAQDARRTASAETAESPMSVVDVGRQVGAEVIVHVDMRVFRLTLDGQSVSPVAVAEVRIYDTVLNEQIWPESGEAHILEVRPPQRPGFIAEFSLSERAAFERDLAGRFALRLARMFYTAERDKSLGE